MENPTFPAGIRPLLTQLQQYAHATARAKGWYEGDLADRNFGEVIALMHSELSEALEAWRKGQDDVRSINGKPEGVAVELVDCVIRILDTLEYLGADFGEVLEEKMRFNEQRSYRHGGKRA